jgi:hypothetical protein
VPLWLWGVDALAFGIIVVTASAALVVIRRRTIAGSRGTFDLSVNRREDATAHGWVLGVGSFRGDTLNWYRTFSFAWWPRYRFRRGELEVLGRRTPAGSELYALEGEDVVIEVRHRSGVRQMAMSASSLNGLQAWLESKPPGHGVNNVL